MNHHFAALLAALLTAAPTSHAQYAGRWAELEPQINGIAHTQVKETLKSSLQSELALRATALEEARKNFLQSRDVAALQEKWVRFHQDQAERRAKQFDDVTGKTKDIIERAKLDEKDPARASLPWLGQIKAQQLDFHDKLKAMPLATLRDTLIEKNSRYETASNDLERELSTLESSDNNIDTYVKGYRATLLQACLDMRAAKIRLEQEAARLPIPNGFKAMDAGEAHAFSAYLLAMVRTEVTDIQRFENSVREATGRIQYGHAQEWDIVRMFSQRRKVATDFDNDFNSKGAQARFAQDFDSATKIAGAVSTAGDKADMTKYLENAREDLNVHLKTFDATYEKFVAKFKGKLLPPFDRDSSERFAEFAEWDDWAEEVQATPAWSMLQDLKAAAAAGWGVRGRFEAIANAEAKAIVEAALLLGKSDVEAAVSRALTEAQRLADLTQLQDRKRMLEALGRG